jgi:hypothetical protein
LRCRHAQWPIELKRQNRLRRHLDGATSREQMTDGASSPRTGSDGRPFPAARNRSDDRADDGAAARELAVAFVLAQPRPRSARSAVLS